MTDLDELDTILDGLKLPLEIFTRPYLSNTVVYDAAGVVVANVQPSVAAIIVAYPALSTELRAARAVAEAGNALYQFGMRHDNDCGTRYDNGDCTCGLDKISHEFVQAWAEWQKARGEG